MALGPPGQFPSHFLIKSLLQLYGKWPWGLLGSVPHISLLNLYYNSIENGPGASWIVSLTVPKDN